MPPPSPIAIATGSLQRLVKEEGSYHKELKSQETRLEKLLASTEEDENKEYSVKQERTAIAETKAVFGPLNVRIEDALHKLEDLVEGGSGSEEEVAKAKGVIESAKVVLEKVKADGK